MVGRFGKKPSNAHVVWTSRAGDGAGKKRFDFEYLELWAAHFGVDYERRTRVDQDRGGKPRDQHVVVSEWAEAAGERFEMGEDTWEFGSAETPRTFVEIDEAGTARLNSWRHEVVLDVRELWLDGPVVRMKTADRGKKALDARELLRGDEPSEA